MVIFDIFYRKKVQRVDDRTIGSNYSFFMMNLIQALFFNKRKTKYHANVKLIQILKQDTIIYSKLL